MLYGASVLVGVHHFKEPVRPERNDLVQMTDPCSDYDS